MDIEERIIEEVRKHKCLYDLEDDKYKNIPAKDKIWAGIGHRLHIDPELCRKRWKTLRDSYKRAKRSEELPSGSSGSSRKKWRYTEQMRFLEDAKTTRKRLGVLPYVSKSGDSTNYSEEEIDSIPMPTFFSTTCKRTKSDIEEKFEEFIADARQKLHEPDTPTETANQMLFSTLGKLLDEANIDGKTLVEVQAQVSNIIFDIIRKSREAQ